MKLATMKDGTRDGSLVVVSQNLTQAVLVGNIAKTMQQALDNWDQIAIELKAIYTQLNEGRATAAFTLNTEWLAAPLPRAYQWADGSAYVNHVELVRKARGAVMPENFWTDPLMYQGGSDVMLGAQDDIWVQDEAYGIDFEAEVAIICSDVRMACTREEAEQAIQLVMLVNDVSLRNLIPDEIAKGFGFFHSKPASAFSPVAVTLDELGGAWQDGKVHLPLISHLNGALFGKPNAGVDMTFDFPTLICHAAKTRFLSAGTIIGSGTVSNSDRSQGSSCIAEKRMLEMLELGKPQTPFMKFGDTIRIEMLDAEHKTIFGAIEQNVRPYSSTLNIEDEK